MKILMRRSVYFDDFLGKGEVIKNYRRITLQDIYQARKVILPFIYETPLIESFALTEEIGASVFLKLENLQRTGSFKVRGATNRIFQLSDEEKSRGVITASTGNHGRAVAYAAQEAGVSAIVCLSVEVPKNKVQAIEALGAKIVLQGESQDDAFRFYKASVGIGGLGVLRPSTLKIMENGVQNILKHFQIIDGDVPKPTTRLMEVPEAGYYAYAGSDGIYEAFYELGDQVQADDAVGQIHYPEDPACSPEVVHIDCGGMLIGTRGPGFVERGDCVAVTARDLNSH